MTEAELKTVRMAFALTQSEAAEKLGVSQPYLSMVERGTRAVSPELASRIAKTFNIPGTALPLGVYQLRSRKPTWFKEQLGALGYPGFAYLGKFLKSNPAELLMDALDTEDLDSRVAEALPWVAVAYPKLDWDWLTRNAKVRDRQNRLGFILQLAKSVATERGDVEVETQLSKRLETLERARLAGEDTLCKRSLTQAESKWLRSHRSDAAAHWNLLSDLTLEQLHHAVV